MDGIEQDSLDNIDMNRSTVDVSISDTSAIQSTSIESGVDPEKVETPGKSDDEEVEEEVKEDKEEAKKENKEEEKGENKEEAKEEDKEEAKEEDREEEKKVKEKWEVEDEEVADDLDGDNDRSAVSRDDTLTSMSSPLSLSLAADMSSDFCGKNPIAEQVCIDEMYVPTASSTIIKPKEEQEERENIEQEEEEKQEKKEQVEKEVEEEEGQREGLELVGEEKNELLADELVEEEDKEGEVKSTQGHSSSNASQSQTPTELPSTSTPPTIDYVTLEDAPRVEKPLTSTAEMEESNLDPKFSEVQSMASGNEKKEHLYKILVIGELGTGKTSIIKRYVHQFFSQHYRATIGVDFALKVISWDADTLIRLQLWDIAGQERFGNMTRVYYKEAVGAFVVFDVTRAPTFEAVVKWKNDLDSKVQLPDGTNIPCVLLANKCDQTKEGLVNNIDQMDDFCKDKGFLGWFETSAKENINIDEAARFLVGQILTNDKSMNTSAEEENKDRILLGNANQQEPTPKKSCCR